MNFTSNRADNNFTISPYDKRGISTDKRNF